jgi:hypothetical protein
MKLQETDIPKLMAFLAAAGRDQENAEAWAHALFDLQESIDRVFESLLPEGLANAGEGRLKREILGDIREEFRHIEYHMRDVEGR